MCCILFFYDAEHQIEFCDSGNHGVAWPRFMNLGGSMLKHTSSRPRNHKCLSTSDADYNLPLHALLTSYVTVYEAGPGVAIQGALDMPSLKLLGRVEMELIRAKAGRPGTTRNCKQLLISPNAQ
jgi:hypothetical protein